MIVFPGLLGGVVVALLIGMSASKPREREPETRLEPLSPHLINMAHIRVAGVGGLGMVAMAIVVAIFVPQIRSRMAIALLLGVVLAAALIAYRRRHGPLGSNTTPGAHAMFPMESAPPPASFRSSDPPPGRRHQIARGPSIDLVLSLAVPYLRAPGRIPSAERAEPT
jgi:hypothetical protein